MDLGYELNLAQVWNKEGNFLVRIEASATDPSQVWPLTQFIIQFALGRNITALFGRQLYEPSSGRALFSSIPPNNCLVLVSET